MAPLVSHVEQLGLIEARAYHQLQCFEAGVLFAKHEGIVPAPEANHAVRGAIEQAERCREEGVSRAILFNLCGHGHFDMQAYTDYFAGKLTDQVYDEASSPWRSPVCRAWRSQCDRRCRLLRRSGGTPACATAAPGTRRKP